MDNYKRIFVRNAIIKAKVTDQMNIWNYHRDTENDYFINRISSTIKKFITLSEIHQNYRKLPHSRFVLSLDRMARFRTRASFGGSYFNNYYTFRCIRAYRIVYQTDRCGRRSENRRVRSKHSRTRIRGDRSGSTILVVGHWYIIFARDHTIY
jgi:hypothetical protein